MTYMSDDRDINKFLNSNYELRLDNTRQHNSPLPFTEHIKSSDINTGVLYNLDISISIQVSIIEAYKGCIKEQVVQRKRIIDEAVAGDKNNDDITEKVCIEVPEGVLNNEIITIKHKGNILATRHGNKYGNINVNINVDDKLLIYDLFKYLNMNSSKSLKPYNVYESDYYTKSGNNAILHKTLTLKEALCGYKFIIPHFNGKLYEIESKPTDVLSPNDKTTIVSRGFNRNNKLGDLVIVYNIIFPNKLTPHQIMSIGSILYDND